MKNLLNKQKIFNYFFILFLCAVSVVSALAQEAQNTRKYVSYMNCTILHSEVNEALGLHVNHKDISTDIVYTIRKLYFENIVNVAPYLLTHERENIKKAISEISDDNFKALLLKGSCSALNQVYRTIRASFREYEESLLKSKERLAAELSTNLEADADLLLSKLESFGEYKTNEERRLAALGYLRALVSKFYKEASLEASVEYVVRKTEQKLQERSSRSHVLAIEALLSGFYSALDAHSRLFTPSDGDSASLLLDETTSTLSVGAVMQETPYGLKMNEILDWSSLKDFSEIKKGDIIFSVNGKKLSGLSLEDARVLITESVSASVELGIGRVNEKKEFKELGRFSVLKKENDSDGLQFRLIKNGSKSFLSIKIPSFYEGVAKQVYNRLTEEKKKLQIDGQATFNGILLDLRDNPGGITSEAVTIVSYFIKSGPILRFVSSEDIQTFSDNDGKVLYQGPLAVAINRGSASASEIVAGALKYYRRALILGSDRTFGKGTAQKMGPLGRLSSVPSLNKPPYVRAITFAQFYLPNGDSTQLRGVTSDIVLPIINESSQILESDLPRALGKSNLSESLLTGDVLVLSEDRELDLATARAKELLESRLTSRPDIRSGFDKDTLTYEIYKVVLDFFDAHSTYSVFKSDSGEEGGSKLFNQGQGAR